MFCTHITVGEVRKKKATSKLKSISRSPKQGVRQKLSKCIMPRGIVNDVSDCINNSAMDSAHFQKWSFVCHTGQTG